MVVKKDPSAASAARTVHIEEDVWKRIRRVAFETDRSASDVIREMVDRELPMFEEEMKKVMAQ